MRHAPIGVALIASALAVAPSCALAGGVTNVSTPNLKIAGVTALRRSTRTRSRRRRTARRSSGRRTASSGRARNFGEFFFTETGDTDSRTEAGAGHGGFGALFKLSQPLRILAQGRDASATLDSWLRTLTVAAPLVAFQNDGDNEITGIHVSDGDASIGGILGAKIPTPSDDGWRVFYTRQHGDNQLYEIIPNRFGRNAEHAGDNNEQPSAGPAAAPPARFTRPHAILRPCSTPSPSPS
jgi:hypothetical protein